MTLLKFVVEILLFQFFKPCFSLQWSGSRTKLHPNVVLILFSGVITNGIFSEIQKNYTATELIIL